MFSFLLYAGVVGVFSQPAADLISNLPGLTWNTNYKQYSGYLDLDNGHHLHYWFTESMGNPATDPVVLWLNGGPGCSSLDGLLYELGPMHAYNNGSLWDSSEYAWNKNANVLYIEAPICVGYSYADGQTTCSMNDNSTAEDNYHGLLKFFAKFPIYAKSSFYVTGESYAGVYVPMLTLRILQGNANNEGLQINLKAFAVGNGVTSSADLDNSLIWFYYHHGMIAESDWDKMQAACCTSPYNRHTCNFYNSASSACRTAVSNGEAHCCHDLNRYDLYGDCYHPSDDEQKNEAMKQRLDESGQLYSFAKLKRQIEFSGTKAQSLLDVAGVPACLDATGATTYLNMASVKNAMHIASAASRVTWSICSNTLHYTSTWRSNMEPIWANIFAMDSSIYATVYNGDTDMACNFLGDEWFVDDMGLPVTDQWREWYVSNSNGQQVGGWTKDFSRIHFVTVRGSGHMVPQYRPQAGYKMFDYFLQNKNLN